MDDTLLLLFLSLAMLIGCYLAGSIPLACNLSEEKIRIVTVLGAGLLVGTSLAVIIPEGVHTLYETASEAAHRVLEEKDEQQQDDNHMDHEHHHTHSHESSDTHTLIGVSLVLGFIFMLLVDSLGGGHSHSPDAENGGTQNRHKMTATIGLVVHAAADGIALGAAATISKTEVEMIVFIAIMLHKAPAAFGLVSFLMHDGLDRQRIRKHLAVFSLSAPLLAVITYFGLSQQSKETLSDINATGITMLFSAGTFLYVATVHILPELIRMSTDKQQGLTRCELCILVIGSLLPLFLSLGHHH